MLEGRTEHLELSSQVGKGKDEDAAKGLLPFNAVSVWGALLLGARWAFHGERRGGMRDSDNRQASRFSLESLLQVVILHGGGGLPWRLSSRRSGRLCGHDPMSHAMQWRYRSTSMASSTSAHGPTWPSSGVWDRSPRRPTLRSWSACHDEGPSG